MTKAVVIAIGDEVLAGSVVNTNGAYMSAALVHAGFEVAEHRVISDERSALKKALRTSMEDADVVICSGGLGPTFDDQTRHTVAEIVGCGFTFSDAVAADLKKRYGNRLSSLDDLAYLPDKAIPFLNSVGTAPGLLFKEEKCTLILLPGVPFEMQAILDEQVIPHLRSHYLPDRCEYRVKVNFFQTPESALNPIIETLLPLYPDIKFGIYPSAGKVSVHMCVMAQSEEEAEERCAAPKRRLEEAFPSFHYRCPSGALEEAVHLTCIERGVTLSTAESCTGGAIASALTALPGASAYFHGSVVSYANSAKEKVLAVDKKTLATHGAVSREVVEQMLQGTLNTFHTDYALAVSGVAGPGGGSAEKPVGTVWVGVQKNGEPPTISLLHAVGNRQSIIKRSVNYALAELLKEIG